MSRIHGHVLVHIGHFAMKVRQLLLMVFPLLFGLAEAQSACRLIAYTDCAPRYVCNKLSILESRDGQFFESGAIEWNGGFRLYWDAGFTISPDGQRIAIMQVNDSYPYPSDGIIIENFVLVFDVSGDVTKIYGIPSHLVAYGSPWSHDSSNLLLIDVYGHYLLSLVDLRTGDWHELWAAPPLRMIRSYQVAWSPDDRLIAAVGNEYPFPVTQNGINDVNSLYIIRFLPDGEVEYAPISDPTADTDFDFVWLSNDRLAFTTFVVNRDYDPARIENPKLQITDVDGTPQFTLNGQYRIVGFWSDFELLVENTGEGISRLMALDANSGQIATLISLPENAPFSLSPDHRFVSYLDAGNQISVQNLQTLSKRSVDVPTERDPGKWSADGQELWFFDYDQNIAYIYDPNEETLTPKTAQQLFPGQSQLPLYPGWLCSSSIDS